MSEEKNQPSKAEAAVAAHSGLLLGIRSPLQVWQAALDLGGPARGDRDRSRHGSSGGLSAARSRPGTHVAASGRHAIHHAHPREGAAGRLSDAWRGHGARTVALWESLPAGQREKIEAAAMDMGADFAAATRQAAHKAKIVHKLTPIEWTKKRATSERRTNGPRSTEGRDGNAAPQTRH